MLFLLHFQGACLGTLFFCWYTPLHDNELCVKWERRIILILLPVYCDLVTEQGIQSGYNRDTNKKKG